MSVWIVLVGDGGDGDEQQIESVFATRPTALAHAEELLRKDLARAPGLIEAAVAELHNRERSFRVDVQKWPVR